VVSIIVAFELLGSFEPEHDASNKKNRIINAHSKDKKTKERYKEHITIVTDIVTKI